MKLGAKRWWTRFITVLAVLLVSAASLSLGFRLLIDAVPGYRGDLERFVTASVGHPARIGTMALTWRAFSPTLELHDLALLDAAGESVLEARKLRLGISLGRLISGPRAPDRIEAEGLQLIAHADADGHLRLEGIDLTGTGDRSLAADFARYARLRLRDCRLRLVDARLGPEAAPLDFVLDEAQLRHGRGGYSVDAVLRPPEELARRLHLVAQISGDLAQPDTLTGRWQLQVTDIAGWPWLTAKLRPGLQLALAAARLQVDGELRGGQPAAMTAQLQVGSLAASEAHAEAPLARLSDIDVEAHFEPASDGGWQLQLSKATLSGTRGAWSLAGLTVSQDADGHRHLQAPLLRLGDVAPWFTAWRDLPAALARLRDVEGDLRAVQLSAGPMMEGQPGTVEVQARLAGVGLASRDDQDGITGLDGDLVASRDSGLIRLAGTQVALHLPRLFERALPVDALRGELRWQADGENWRIDVPSVELQVGAALARGSVGLALHPDRVPDLKLRLQLQSDEVAQLKPWMPKNWGEHTRAWLDQAIREARVSAGELLIDAPLTPRDADNHPTLPWDLKLKVRDGVLAFAPDWPAAEAMSAELHFHDGGLDIEASKGRISRLDVSRLHASIENFFDPHLAIDAAFTGDAADLYQLFRNSPLKARVSGLLAHTEASGPAAATLALRLPLNIAQPPVDVSGVLSLRGAELRIHGLPEPLRQLNGDLAYGRSITAEHLSATLYDTEVQASIRALEPVPDPLLSGSFDLEPGRSDGLAAAFIPAWLRAGLSGTTVMSLQLPLGGPDNGHLSLASDLQGVASILPLPLAKTAGSALPLTIDVHGDGNAARLGIQVGGELRVGLRLLDDGPRGTRTHGVEALLGTAGDMPRADAEGLVIRGAPEHLDLGGWIALLGSPGNGLGGEGGAGPRFLRADIEAKRLSLRRLQFGPTRLIAQPAGDGLRVLASGAANGELQWQPANGGSVIGRLASVSLEAFPPLPPGQPGVLPAESPFDPTRAPLFDLDIEALSLGGVALGHLNLVTARVDDGQRIERLSLGGGRLQGSASGFWLRRTPTDAETSAATGSAGSSADLSFDLHSDAIGDVLQVFGYTPNLVAKASHFSGAVAWPRVPAGLELSQAAGSIDIALERGSLKAVEPGAGRVLGLVNLYALPRRLLFDFRDVVSEGLGFDELKGSFKLAAGDAVTDNLNIDGPSLKVEMRGRIGLAARDYDQKVTVFPDLSTGVTVGAALLGGPIAGGILLVAQQLFDKPFNQLGKFSYRVTGSWDDPTVIKSGEAAPPAVAVPAPAAVKPSNG